MLEKIPKTTEQDRYTQQYRINTGMGLWQSAICKAARFSAVEFFIVADPYICSFENNTFLWKQFK